MKGQLVQVFHWDKTETHGIVLSISEGALVLEDAEATEVTVPWTNVESLEVVDVDAQAGEAG